MTLPPRSKPPRSIAALTVTLAALAAVHAATAAPRGSAMSPAAAAARIDGTSFLGYISTLASDDFEGRSPGTHGESMTIDYLQQQFKKLGLAPGNPDGTYLQQVPMVAGVTKPQLSYSTGAKSTALSFPDDYVAWDSVREPNMNLANSELVFVGYGVTAPEYKWDDYKGVDLHGKTLVMLINDPPIPDPRNASSLDPAMFGGDAMTYYGRWTYKYEMAAKLGAAGALIVHETKPAAYPYEVVRNSWGRENFAIASDGANPNFPPLSGWLQLDRAKDIFRSVGYDFDTLKKSALSRDFRPVPLGVTVSVTAANTWRDVASNNVVAKIEGADPRLKNEYVIYTAHWDHFGIDDSLPGPRTRHIFHGAQDNASGVAMLLEVAKAYKALRTPPKRSVLFVITTGEERGLLGSQYYARHPLYPLDKTLVSINVDVANVWGRTRDVEIVGAGKSTTDEIVTRAARRQRRTARLDTQPEAGRFYRSDQFELAKVGVPVVYLKGGKDFIGKPASYGKDKAGYYTAHDYHKVSDVVQPGWNMAGAVQDAQLIFNVGYDVAQGKAYPQWKAGAEFKAVRENGAGAAHSVLSK
ncbi:MAG TPA: M20/M25/M40 family metallo-hydrolase [Janthinobacterium sp.]|nr:M20/M25/M40 family metallo-hydrolase [Janthinobacterium sp.]